MPHNKRGHAVANQYYPYKLLFYPSVLNRDTLHPNHLLSSLHPYSRHACSSSPRLSMFEGGGSSGVGRHCGRSGTVKPPSFHAPLALMCTHAGRLLKAIQTASWWDHSCFLSHVLTPQTLCPLLSSKTDNVGDFFFFFKSLVKVRPASGNHGLTSVTAVECRSEFIWGFRKDNTSDLNVTRCAKSFLNFFFHPGFHIINCSISHVWNTFHSRHTENRAVRSIQTYLSFVSCQNIWKWHPVLVKSWF